MSGSFKGVYKGKKVLVTGATGFKGSWLSIWLKSLGADVIGYSMEPLTSPSMFEICNIEDKIVNIIGDIRDYSSLAAAIDAYRPEVVFHLAAQPLVRESYKSPVETYETNVMGTVNLLEASRKSKSVSAVVVVTTDKCYENKEWIYGYRESDPMGGFDPYSSSKACSELVVSAYTRSFYNESNIALASARAGNVIGGGDWASDRLIPDFVRSLEKEVFVVIRNPLATRPWQHVLEPLSGYLWLGASMIMDNKSYNSGWNFGPKDSDVLDVESVLKMAIKNWGKGNVFIDKTQSPHEAQLLKLDTSKSRAYLNWHSLYNIEESIERTVNWYRSYYEDKDTDMYEYTVKQIKEYENTATIHGILWGEQK